MRSLKLNDIQLILLATAVQRDDGSLLPPPERLGDQAARIRRAIPPLLKHALVEEIAVAEPARSWRERGGEQIGLAITAAGRAVIAIDEQVEVPPPALGTPAGSIEADTRIPGEAAMPAPVPVPNSKIAMVVALLKRDGGATVAELTGATGWLPHTTRAALTGLRKKGHDIERGSRDGATSYSIAADA